MSVELLSQIKQEIFIIFSLTRREIKELNSSMTYIAFTAMTTLKNYSKKTL